MILRMVERIVVFKTVLLVNVVFVVRSFGRGNVVSLAGGIRFPFFGNTV